MEYRTVNDLTEYLKHVIDNYWNLEVSRNHTLEIVKRLFSYQKNRGIAMRGDKFTPSFERKLGKKRLLELRVFLKEIDAKLYNDL